jgi:hypothetical protein
VRRPGSADGARADDGDAFHVFGIGEVHRVRIPERPFQMTFFCIMAPGVMTPGGA